ncbi:MAG TPA: Ig-like domain-containing protein [Gemmatimonadaceae bacterium]
MARSCRRTTIGLICASTFVVGCSYSSGPYGRGENVPVNGVTITPQTIQFVAVGETKQLVARISPADANDKAVTWESSDPTVASVDNTGLVTARSSGAGVFITVTTHDGHHEASANIGVNR